MYARTEIYEQLLFLQSLKRNRWFFQKMRNKCAVGIFIAIRLETWYGEILPPRDTFGMHGTF